MKKLHENLINALSYLQEVIDNRLSLHFDKKNQQKNSMELPEFGLKPSDDIFTRFITACEFSIEEFITLLCVLVPHIIPNFFERIVAKYLSDDTQFPEFGGYKGANTRYMMPTVNTVLFILGGDDLSRRLELLEIFDSEHFFAREKVLSVDETTPGEPFLSRKLLLDDEYVELFTRGRISIPTLSTTFPAELLRTEMEWQDLVLNPATPTTIGRN